MESTWDIVFACKTELINRNIRERKMAFLGAFDYKNGTLCAEIPEFQIGWAGNEQYMAVDLTLRNVRISVGGITEEHDQIRSRAHLQFSFKDEKNVGFVCKTLAESSGDVRFGAVWIENPDVTGEIKEEILQDSFGTILARALIEQESRISIVLAKLNADYFQPLSISVCKSVPAFQNLDGTPVMAVMCAVRQTEKEPSRQFSPQLLMGFDFGYIMSRRLFLEKFILPRIPQLLHISGGNFKVLDDNSIVNEGSVFVSKIKVSATSYTIEASLIKLQFVGDHLHLLVEGTVDFTGLADSYISYTFHSVRSPRFTPENGGRVYFAPIAGNEDEFHSDKHIPLWIEITAGIFTFGLFTMISELIGNEIQSRVKNMMNDIHYNGEEGGYFLTWADQSLQFTDGGYAANIYMRG